MAGQIQVMFDLTAAALQFIKAGKIRGLAVTSVTRTPSLPDLPPIGDFLPGYEATSFEGIAAPKNTSAEIVDKLNKTINAGFTDQSSRRGWPTWAATACRARPPILQKSSPTKPINGARWSSSRASRLSNRLNQLQRRGTSWNFRAAVSCN